MNEMINSATSLLPLFWLNDSNTIYLNSSIVIFVIIASVNHVLPENF